MGSIKDRNGMDLTEAEDTQKRWQQNTKYTKKIFTDPDNHNGVPSPPLALFVVMLPKAHLTSHSRMSGSR